MKTLETIQLDDMRIKAMIRKFTVEERDDGFFISTNWDCEDCFECDRQVKEFETESGAYCDMYRNVISVCATIIRSKDYLILGSRKF